MSQKESEWEREFDDRFHTTNNDYDGGKMLWVQKEEVKSFLKETISQREKEIAKEVAVTFAKSPLNKRKDKDADAFYLDVLQIIKH